MKPLRLWAGVSTALRNVSGKVKTAIFTAGNQRKLAGRDYGKPEDVSQDSRSSGYAPHRREE